MAPKNRQLPLWDELGRAVADEIPDFPYSGASDAISAYAHEFSRARLVEIMSQLLFVGKAQPGVAHRAFCSIPFDLVCTTNLEFLLEDGYRAVDRYCRPVIDEDQLSVAPRDSAVTLLKLHGDLHHPQRLVVTEEDYDRFLTAHPLLATYLANLLITRTAVLIGYSADDPDFRQLWQLVGDRLGKLRRMAYAIMVSPRTTDIARFARRGVKVLALPGSPARYGDVLGALFDEIRTYQAEKVVSASQVTEEHPLAELVLPKESVNRLCFLSVPQAGLPFYKDRVFELVRRHGFVPVTADDVLAPGDAVAPKVEALIGRSELVIADASQPWTRYELAQARRRLGPHRVLAVLQKDLPIPADLADVRFLRRPTLPVEEPEPLLAEIDRWLTERAEAAKPKLAEEPDRLLRLREYRAAVVAAVTLLESSLRERLEPAVIERGASTSVGRLVETARQSQIITPEEAGQLEAWRRLRNLVVHSPHRVTGKTAREAVTGILQIVRRLVT
ncbi:MAG: SIR2 family protein [Vicinamibacteria bacterium]